MNLYTLEYQNESVQKIGSYVSESGLHTDTEIQVWIRLNKKDAIVESMKDETNWQEILLDCFKPEHIDQIERGQVRVGRHVNNYEEVRDHLLFVYWRETVIDWVYEIDQVLENMDDEPDTRSQDDAAERSRDMQQEF